MVQKGIFYDMTGCIGCKVCQIACRDKNNLEQGVWFREVKEFEGGKYPQPWRYYISSSCNHCDDPKCVANCPTGAMHKRAEDGIVVVDHSKCIGCEYCTWNCPYGAPKYDKKIGKVRKCNGCIELEEKGELPACVQACLMRVLHVKPVEEIKKEHKNLKKDVVGLADSSLTKPNFFIKPNKYAEKGGV